MTSLGVAPVSFAPDIQMLHPVGRVGPAQATLGAGRGNDVRDHLAVFGNSNLLTLLHLGKHSGQPVLNSRTVAVFMLDIMSNYPREGKHTANSREPSQALPALAAVRDQDAASSRKGLSHLAPILETILRCC